MVRAIIFDTDGVLLDTYGANAANYMTVFKKYNCTFDKEGYTKQFGYSSEFIIKEQLEAQKKYAPEVAHKILLEYYELTDKSPLQLHKGVLDLLNKLKLNGYLMGVASNREESLLHSMLKKAEVLHYFQVAIGLGKNVRRKPAPDMYFLVAEKLECAPDECMVIEDSIAGLKAAIDAGMKVIAITTGSQNYDDLFSFLMKESVGDFQIIDSLSEISLHMLD